MAVYLLQHILLLQRSFYGKIKYLCDKDGDNYTQNKLI